MSINSWVPRQPDMTSYSKSMTLILLGVALGSGVCFVLVITLLVQNLWCRRCCDVDAEGGGEGVERCNSGSITTSVLAALPTFGYWKGKTDGGGSGRWGDCAVCLEAVREGELVRRLPACDHTFHVECIDMWLCSHSTCPLCRDTVELVEVVKGKENCRSEMIPLPLV